MNDLPEFSRKLLAMIEDSDTWTGEDADPTPEQRDHLVKRITARLADLLTYAIDGAQLELRNRLASEIRKRAQVEDVSTEALLATLAADIEGRVI